MSVCLDEEWHEGEQQRSDYDDGYFRCTGFGEMLAVGEWIWGEIRALLLLNIQTSNSYSQDLRLAGNNNS